jgi:peptidoglycan/xylan/chitin deacetylase (PgdA/CDA1 family)/3D (Asp-Asp-Asp) domain-containing protein
MSSGDFKSCSATNRRRDGFSRGFKKISGRVLPLFTLAALALTPGLASASDPGPKLGTFWTTYYYVPNETDYPPLENSSVKDISGQVLSTVNSQFKKDVDVEGTGIIRSGKTINFAGRVNSEIRYRYSKARWGWGIGACELKPFHTIAVDANMIPLGTVVYIPKAKGMKLPDGSVHDGIFYAEDIGSAINHMHIDMFASEGLSSGKVYESAGIKTGTFVDVYKVSDPDPNGCQTLPPQNPGSKRFKNLMSRAHALQLLADEYAATGHRAEFEEALERLNQLHPLVDTDHGGADLEGSSNDEMSDSLLLMHLDAQRASIQTTVAAKPPVKKPSVVGDTTTAPIHAKGYADEFNGTELEPGEIVVTFDDGPHPRYTPVIAKLVKDLGIPATFFEVGEMVEAHPELSRLIADDGKLIGNHSYNHPEMTKLSDAQVNDQFNRTQKIIQKAIGGEDEFSGYVNQVFGSLFKLPRTIYFPEFFRHPYGARNARTMKIAQSLIAGTVKDGNSDDIVHLKHVMWNIDSLDWKDHSPASIEARVFNEIHMYKRGIILMHDIHPQSMEAAQLILPRLKREGYKLLSMYDVLFEQEAKAQNQLRQH